MTVQYSQFDPRPQEPISGEAFHEWNSPDGSPWTLFFRHGAGYRLRFPELADFEISADGQTVKGIPAPGVATPTVEHLFLNQVLPLALSRQGRLVLHGSAVDLGGVAVAFLGRSGRGKSTLAASFATTGARFLTDDGLQLMWSEGRLLVVPSHPSIRLWQDSEAALIRGPVNRSAPPSYSAKNRLCAGEHIPFCDTPQVLRRMYFLGDRPVAHPVITPLSPVQALVALVNNSFLLDIEQREVLSSHFEDLTRLVERPQHFQLDFPRRYDALPSVRSAIMRHTIEDAIRP